MRVISGHGILYLRDSKERDFRRITKSYKPLQVRLYPMQERTMEVMVSGWGENSVDVLNIFNAVSPYVLEGEVSISDSEKGEYRLIYKGSGIARV